MAATQMNPLNGKMRFKMRTFNNFLFIIVIFTAFAFAAVRMFPDQMGYVWLADTFAICLLYYFHRVFLNKRAIRIQCPHCQNTIATNTPWMCGSCGAKNEHVEDFPFVNRCKECSVEPKAYQCHHDECEKLIFLTEDELIRNYAYCINPVMKPTKAETEQTKFESKKRRAEYKLHLTKLNIEVELAQRVEKDLHKKDIPTEDKIKEHREKRRSKTIVATEAYRKERKANEEEYKDDPEMLKMVMEDLENWYRDGDWERIV